MSEDEWEIYKEVAFPMQAGDNGPDYLSLVNKVWINCARTVLMTFLLRRPWCNAVLTTCKLFFFYFLGGCGVPQVSPEELRRNSSICLSDCDTSCCAVSLWTGMSQVSFLKLLRKGPQSQLFPNLKLPSFWRALMATCQGWEYQHNSSLLYAKHLC